jgi:hypothetical protein
LISEESNANKISHKKRLALAIVVLFVGTSITALGEPSDATFTKTNATIGLHDCSRDQIELHYYDPNTLCGVIGGPSGSPQVWKTAIRLTQTELYPYNTWNLTKVVIGFSEDEYEGPVNVTIIIYDNGTPWHPGPLIVDDTHTVLTGDGLILIPLVTPVALAGHTELWVAVQWYQNAGLSHYAYIDAGPAVVGKGDWIYLNNAWCEIQSSIDSNWAIGAIVEGQNLATLSIANIKGRLGITAEVQNTGDVTAYNITWSIAVEGGILGKVSKITTGTQTALFAHQTLAIRQPMVIGFGLIRIMITAQASNAVAVAVTKTAFLVGPLVVRIRLV